MKFYTMASTCHRAKYNPILLYVRTIVDHRNFKFIYNAERRDKSACVALSWKSAVAAIANALAMQSDLT